jgi:hypothetical protein
MSTIDELLQAFRPISLKETEHVRLMNRTDTKFVFHVQHLCSLFPRLVSTHDVLEINGVRGQRYHSLYYDTPEFKCYLDHHNKRMNRFKVRSRTYVDSGMTYFEIKIKSNKGRTRKERVQQLSAATVFGTPETGLLARETGLKPENLRPSIQIGFNRITLVDQARSARITLDTGLNCSDGRQQRAFPWLVIAEVKQDRTQPSAFRQALALEHIHDFRISKYCVCMAMLDPSLRQNNFKQKIHRIQKLESYDSPTNHPLPAPLFSLSAR